MKKVEVKVDVDTKKATKDVEKLTNATKKQTVATKEQGEALNKMPGGFGKAAKAAKAFGAALMANPIGLILGLIVGLFAAIGKIFSKFQPVIEWIEQKIGAISAAIDVLIGNVEELGAVLLNALIGNWKQANAGAKDLNEKLQKAAKIGEEIVKWEQDLGDAIETHKIKLEDINGLLLKQKDIINDERASMKDRQKAADDYAKLIKAQNKIQYEDAIKAVKIANGKLRVDENAVHQLQKLTKEQKQQLINIGALNKKNEISANTYSKIALLKKYQVLTDESLKNVVEAVLKRERAKTKEYQSQLMITKNQNKLDMKKLTQAKQLATLQISLFKLQNDKKIKDEDLLNNTLIEKKEKFFQEEYNKSINALKKQKSVELLLAGKNEALIAAAHNRYSIGVLNAEKKKSAEIEKLNNRVNNKREQVIKDYEHFYKASNKEILENSKIYLLSQLKEYKKVRKGIYDYDIELINERLKNGKISEKEAAAEKLDILNSYKDDVKKINDSMLKSEKDSRGKSLMDLQEEKDKKKKIIKKSTDDEIALEKQAIQEIADIGNALINLQQQQIDTRLNAELDAIETKKDAELKAHNYTEEQKKIVNDKYAKMEDDAKRKAFEQHKKYELAQLAINTASAIIGTWAGYSSEAWVGAAAAAVQTAGIVALAGIQAATIESQKYAKGGLLIGPSHADGGIKTKFGELEGNEYVINKFDTQRMLPALESINNGGDVININKLASMINNKQVVISSLDMTNHQKNDVKIYNTSKLK